MIDIDLSWMRIGKVGGAEQATYELMRGISLLDRDHSYTLHAPRGTYYDWNFDHGFRHRVRFSDRIEEERRSLRGEAGGAIDADLLHAPSGFLPQAWNARRLVVTIHDLQHLSFPDNFSAAEQAYRDQQLATITRRADHLIAISEFTKSELIHHYGVDETRISVIWMSPDPLYAVPQPASRLRQVCRSMGIHKPFILYPAYPWAHKNHQRLLQAWQQRLARPGVEACQLVLTGRPFAADHPAHSLLQEAIASGSVLHLGYRSPREMRALFQAAHALVFPSQFEGFGLPVVEAFLAGLPVAASTAGSLREICGDAALLFDPTDTQAMAAAIDSIGNDRDLRHRLIERGRERGALFHPCLTASQTIAVYDRVLTGVGNSSGNTQRGKITPSPLRRSPRFEAFRHHARRAEALARSRQWWKMCAAAACAFCFAPIRAFQRLAGGAACHVEVYFRRMRYSGKL